MARGAGSTHNTLTQNPICFQVGFHLLDRSFSFECIFECLARLELGNEHGRDCDFFCWSLRVHAYAALTGAGTEGAKACDRDLSVTRELAGNNFFKRRDHVFAEFF